MKNFKRTLFAIAIVLMSASASAGGFKWGVKAGVALNNIHFNEDILNDLGNSDNHAGFTGGLMMEFTVPVINLGFDASVMYVHREAIETGSEKLYRDYIEIPINFKYKIGLPIVGNVVTPYLFTGPSFAFKTGKSEIKDFVKSKKCDIAGNVGVGVDKAGHHHLAGTVDFPGKVPGGPGSARVGDLGALHRHEGVFQKGGGGGHGHGGDVGKENGHGLSSIM